MEDHTDGWMDWWMIRLWMDACLCQWVDRWIDGLIFAETADKWQVLVHTAIL